MLKVQESPTETMTQPMDLPDIELLPSPEDFPTEQRQGKRLILLLSAGLVLASVLLVLIELAQPAPQPDFEGIRFANTVNSPGSRAIVAMYRDHLEWLPRPYKGSTIPPQGYIWGLRAAWGAMILLQIAAILVCRRFRPTSQWGWAIGPALASVVLLLYPPSSTDIFAYASFGWVADVGENPYLRTPESVPGDPFAIFNDWTHIQTPYGPIWTGISQAIVHLANHEPFATAIGFKIVATLAAFGLALVTYHLAKRLSSSTYLPVIAFVFVWWSPILITESAAPVHLDSLMMFLAVLGLAVATGTKYQSYRLGLALIVASALIKPATLPLIALMIVARVVAPERIGVVIRRMAGDVLLTLAIISAGYAAFWDTSLPRAMYDNAKMNYADEALRSNPLWMWGLAHIDSVLGIGDAIGGDARDVTRWLAIGIMLIVATYFGRALLRQRRELAQADQRAVSDSIFRFMIWAWTAVTLVLALLPVNTHPWYAIWPLATMALLWISDGRKDRLRPPVWLLVVQGWILISFMIYHTLQKT